MSARTIQLSDKIFTLNPNVGKPMIGYCTVTDNPGWGKIVCIDGYIGGDLLPSSPVDGTEAYTDDWGEQTSWRYDLTHNRWVNETLIEYVDEHCDDLIELGWIPPKK